jgi:ArsR family transcriptional regulator
MIMELWQLEAVAALFKALGDPTRLRIFEMLRCCGEGVAIDEAGQCRPANALSVGEVCCQLGQSMSTVSFHLKELRLAGLIRTEKRGRWIYCSVNPEALTAIRAFLETPCGWQGEAGSSPAQDIDTREEEIVGR